MRITRDVSGAWFMTSDGSVTHWIEEICAGDRDAAVQALWERYFAQLVRYARKRLEAMPRRVADEEDVALSAFKSFCQAAEAGRFPDLAGRDDLWRLLLRMTARKAVDLIRYNARQKRRVRGESVLAGSSPDSSAPGIAQVIGESPSPEFAAMVAEENERLLKLLDPDLRAVALLKLEGHTNQEIANKHDCSLRTVERQLRLIRKKWEREVQA